MARIQAVVRKEDGELYLTFEGAFYPVFTIERNE